MKKKFYKLLSITLFTFGAFFINAQNIGINVSGNNPDPSAALDVDFNNKGVLLPRVSLQSDTDLSTIANPATSLLVYNTNSNMTDGSEGYWFWEGNKWEKVATGAAHSSLIATSVESAGANCPNGGIKIEVGLDTNNNGTLDPGEVNNTQTQYVCNGSSGGSGGGSGSTIYYTSDGF